MKGVQQAATCCADRWEVGDSAGPPVPCPELWWAAKVSAEVRLAVWKVCLPLLVSVNQSVFFCFFFCTYESITIITLHLYSLSKASL